MTMGATVTVVFAANGVLVGVGVIGVTGVTVGPRVGADVLTIAAGGV